MKQFFALPLLVLLFLSHAMNAFAQPVVLPQTPINLDSPGLNVDYIIKRLEQSITVSDTGEGGRASQIDEFARIWKDRVSHNDSSGSNMFEQYLRVSQESALARSTSGNCSSENFSGRWSGIGPDTFSTQNLGMINDIWADSSNTNYLLAVGYGGVWRSDNGGTKWVPIADNTPVSKGIVSPNTIAVNPTNTQHFYVGSYTYFNQVLRPQNLDFSDIYLDHYGNGLLVTTNGGNTWSQEILPISNPLTWKDSVRGAKPYFSPDGQRVYGMHNNKLFCKSVNGNWKDITPVTKLTGSYFFFEMKFVPTGPNQFDPNHFYLVAHGTNQLLECHYNPISDLHDFDQIPLPPNAPMGIDGFYIGIPNEEIFYAAFLSSLYIYSVGSAQWSYVRDT